MNPYTRDAVEAELRHAMRAQDWGEVDVLQRQLDIADHPPRRVPVLAAALWYAQHGIPVFPLQPLSKTPHPGTRGCKDATTDQDRIRSWWDAHPDSNVAIATGHVLDAFDFDGPQGHAHWTAEAGDHWEDGGVTVLGTVSTPRAGGLHIYVRTTGEGNKAGMLPGMDYRGRGGYVVAPPSSTPQGTYRFLRALNPEDL